MSNDYFNNSADLVSFTKARANAVEQNFDSVAAGFDKLPTITGNANKVVAVNSGATALYATTILTGITFTGSVFNGTVGATTPSTGAFTTVSASVGITGNLTGNVGGNLAGDVTSSGTSSFNNVAISGTLDMNSGTAGTITGLATPSNTSDAATKGYVDTAVSNLVNGAPLALDTLNELSAALGNDASFATTMTNSLATKLNLSGGTMTGALNMGTYKITGLGAPTVGSDAVTLTYLTTLYGSTAAAAASASAAATSETNAAGSATSASGSATSALGYLNDFKGRYYGAYAADPTLDPLGAAMNAGDLYWNTASSEMRVYSGSAWSAAYLPASTYVTGAASSVDSEIALFSSTTGKVIKRATTTGMLKATSGVLAAATAGTDYVSPTGSETLTNKTIEAGTFTNGYTEETVTANTSTAYTIDLANGTVQILTLTGNCTFTFPTATAGKSFMLLLKQDATGSRTVTWPSVTNPVKWPSSTAPTITATASKMDKFVFTADGTNWIGSNAGQNYL